MDIGNPITTFSVTNLQSIAAATEVKAFPRPISSATSAPASATTQVSVRNTRVFRTALTALTEPRTL